MCVERARPRRRFGRSQSADDQCVPLSSGWGSVFQAGSWHAFVNPPRTLGLRARAEFRLRLPPADGVRPRSAAALGGVPPGGRRGRVRRRARRVPRIGGPRRTVAFGWRRGGVCSDDRRRVNLPVRDGRRGSRIRVGPDAEQRTRLWRRARGRLRGDIRPPEWWPVPSPAAGPAAPTQSVRRDRAESQVPPWQRPLATRLPAGSRTASANSHAAGRRQPRLRIRRRQPRPERMCRRRRCSAASLGEKALKDTRPRFCSP